MNYRLLRFDSVASTMLVARHFALQSEPEGIVIVAEEQTAGRGRAGHTWFSPSGQSLYLSILLRPRLDPHQLNWLTMIGALAIIDTLQSIMPNGESMPRPSLRWFNDVHLNGRKISGVLVESTFMGDAIDYSILGIGLNVNTQFTTAPPDVQARASSLANEFGREFDREVVLTSLLTHFAHRYAQLTWPNANPINDYARWLETIGKPVKITLANGIVEGLAESIDPDGALIVRDAQHCRHRCVYGEI